ncbi:heparan-alpha-glucosaminide N-acetyltransferase domain-containing protein [Streptomyces sp. NPDC057702]|uniref:heparan-alpha-glucosaminide N-acetyltransferase domain-containing protein n=1 Tax=unclassified Streptomyces TaxID=2593676 RepID=UPI003681EE89
MTDTTRADPTGGAAQPAGAADPGPVESAGEGRSTAQAATEPAPPASDAGARAPDATGPGAARLVGLDLARGLAVFGMYAAHLGPLPVLDEPTGFLVELAHGRSSALFAVLAGLTLVILAGRRSRPDPRDRRRAALRIAIRAVILLALGSALTAGGTKVEVILAYYGLFFLLALPFAWLASRTLALVAVGWALVGPQLLYVVDDVLWDSPLERALAAHDPLARWADGEGVIQLLATGNYPALSWMPFVFAGMAVGRLDLRAARVRRRLAVVGPALAVLGYGASHLALRTPWIGDRVGMPHGWWADTDQWPEETNPAQLLLAAPHSGATLSLVANTGVALTVIVAALAAVDGLPRLRRLAAPVIAVGGMSLSAYVFHIAGIGLLDIDIEDPADLSLGLLAAFVASVSVLAYGWSHLFRRGPLEYGMHHVSRLARLWR